ncbi:lysozyme [Achromobacter xylosoxidans]|uniref:Lysozyme n=1 Tax=Alcaligenes xylosoxydans xylosoxydans TaxID=85698 RepID=A0A0X8NXP9_ALCXX|nr:lysozyme [Achromobacter xylosoxidans]AMG36238.1 glycosyl hydrolase [Achromobacter xylosoxidans]
MKTGTKRTLQGTVGAGAAAMLLNFVPQVEGTILRGYKDPIGVVTACSGHTKTAVLGRPYSQEECRRLLESDLVDHAEGVLACTPALSGHQYQLAAATSFAFNVGVGAYCRSATARRFNSGDWAGACRAMNQADNGKPQWVWAGGQMLPGLIKRRTIEREMCETELPK